MPILTSKFKVTKNKHTGPAKVLKTHKEISTLKPGDVMVVQHTSPEWMEAFEFLQEYGGAIVTEVGGMLCHAAITSREYKIPCVVSINKARNLLEGKIVTVDGPNGTVSYDE